MSPVTSVRKGKLAIREDDGAPVKTEARLSSRDWMWVGIAALCTWLMLTGLHRLFQSKPVTAAVPTATVAQPTQPLLPESPPPTPPPERKIIMHADAVQATVESLRQHSKDNPEAPDALSEERIKAIEEDRALIL
jgi:hypothetical protein